MGEKAMRTKRAAFEKVVHLGYVKGTYQGFACNHPVFCKIAFKAEGERGCLSISGVVGPRTHGHCESCGQIVGTRLDGLAPGWDAATVEATVPRKDSDWSECVWNGNRFPHWVERGLENVFRRIGREAERIYRRGA